MLKRKAMQQFEGWKSMEGNHALLVTGARQVGKSFLINAFAHENYENVVMFDLVENPAVKRSFSQATDADDLALRISLMADAPLVPGKTIVFIDEVQECPEVVTYIKYLVQRGDYDYVLSGSLLGVQLENVRSFPVGYVTEVRMYPLDFEEFCWAMGANEQAYETVKACVREGNEVPDFLHERMLGLFRRYLLVGGMPDAVDSFVESKQVDPVRTAQSDIRRQYHIDISKYAPKDRRLVIQDIFDRIPAQLSQQNRRFELSSIENVKRYSQVSDAFLWLAAAGVAIPVYNVSAPAFPLMVNEQRKTFKLFSNDVGLLSSAFTKRDVAGFLDGTPPMNLRGVYENFIAQELVALGFTPRYFTKKGIGELDLLFERADGRVVAIESKSGRSYRAHKALDNALGTKGYGIDEAYVLAECNVSKDGHITYLPVYAAGCLDEAGA